MKNSHKIVHAEIRNFDILLVLDREEYPEVNDHVL